MKRIKLTLLTIAAITIALPFASQAKEKTKEAATAASTAAASPAAKGPRANPYRGKISAVDTAAKTFTIQGKEKARVFKITDQTKLEKSGGAPATMEDVKVGEEVRGTCMKNADGSLDAKLVRLGPKTPEEIAAAEAAKAKKAAKAAATTKP